MNGITVKQVEKDIKRMKCIHLAEKLSNWNFSIRLSVQGGTWLNTVTKTGISKILLFPESRKNRESVNNCKCI